MLSILHTYHHYIVRIVLHLTRHQYVVICVSGLTVRFDFICQYRMRHRQLKSDKCGNERLMPPADANDRQLRHRR